MTEEREDDLLGLFEEGLTFFLRLDAEQTMHHVKAHSEDLFSFVSHPSGRGDMMCTAKGIKALEELTQERLAARSDGNDFDLSEVMQEIRRHITRHLVETSETGGTLNKAFADTYNEAIISAKAKQTARIYHFPCVLASADDPPTFSIGPVRFTTASRFEESLLELDPEKQKFKDDIRDIDFREYIKAFGWIVSVKIPSCSSKVSVQRAELVARTAINIVKVWFGSGYSERMRLVHTEPATSAFSRYLIGDDEGLFLSWSRKSEGASVMNGWFDRVKQGSGAHYEMVSYLLHDLVSDQSSEMSERLVDALSWYGDASFEPSPGAKVAKLTMLLERLTSLSLKFSKKRFCRYVAMLALDDDNDFESKYWLAYDFYNARCDISHASKSQFSVAHWESLRKAEPMIVNCIFRAVEIYWLFRSKDVNYPTSLKGFFDLQENLWRDKWKLLDKEMSDKELTVGR